MAGAFQGPKEGNVGVPRNRHIFYAGPGSQFDDVDEAGKLGLRESASIVTTQISVSDLAKRKVPDAYNVEIDGKFMQTTFVELKNFYLLGKYKHQLAIQDGDGNYWNFVDNTGDPGSENGSALVSLNWKFTADDKDRVIECKWNSRLYDGEVDWLTNSTNMATQHVGGTGDASLAPIGLTAMTGLVRANRRRSGIRRVDVNGVNIGEHNGGKFEMSCEGPKDFKERALNRLINIKAEIMMLQTMPADIRAAITSGREDLDIKYYFAGGEFVLLHGVALTDSTAKKGDGDQNVKLSFEGQITNNFNEAMPDVMTWAANSLTINATGY